MPDLNGWPLACLALMVAIIVTNHLIETGGKR